jgi:uncharacterized protein YacL
MEITKIKVLSAAKIFGILNAIVGLILGLVIGLMALAGVGQAEGSPTAIFGVGAIVILPILYGVMGFISGALMSFVYNLIAGKIGGLVIETK